MPKNEKIKKLPLQKLMRKVNDAIGEEAFRRYSDLPIDNLIQFEDLMQAGKIDMHRDGFAGFKTQLPDGSMSNEGYYIAREKDMLSVLSKVLMLDLEGHEDLEDEIRTFFPSKKVSRA